VLGFQVVSLVFTLVWEARYQRAVDAVERAVQQLEAYDDDSEARYQRAVDETQRIRDELDRDSDDAVAKWREQFDM
jgi:hypothetical protein